MSQERAIQDRIFERFLEKLQSEQAVSAAVLEKLRELLRDRASWNGDALFQALKVGLSSDVEN